MLETLVLVTFLLTNGTKVNVPVYPPGGEYHRQFGFVCESNRPLMQALVQRLISEKKIATPENTERVERIAVFCLRSHAV